MAHNTYSTSADIPGSAMAESVVYEGEKTPPNYEKKDDPEHKFSEMPTHESASIKAGFDSTHRQLKPRHIQLIGIGGTIGTALYVQIGRGLINGGPGSLFLAFTIWYVLSDDMLWREAAGPAFFADEAQNRYLSSWLNLD